MNFEERSSPNVVTVTSKNIKSQGEQTQNDDNEMRSLNTWFNARKAAQVAAFFALQEDGLINVLKLTKLIYLADRKHMEKYDYPILNDELVSMDHGPVNSMTYDFIAGYHEHKDWDEFITDRENHLVGLSKDISSNDLDELSNAEIVTLEETWGTFGHLGKYAIRDWTHENCPEWEDPHGSSSPIPYERVYKFLGKKNAELLEENIRDHRALSETFSC